MLDVINNYTVSPTIDRREYTTRTLSPIEIRRFSVSSPNPFFVQTSIEQVTKMALFDSTSSSTFTNNIWSSPSLTELLTDLQEIIKADDYDDDFVKPSVNSINQTMKLILGAVSKIRKSFPVGNILTDGDGGLRIEWILEKKELRLSIPSQTVRKGYIYHESINSYGADYLLTSSNLAIWMDWLSTNDGDTN